MLLVVPQLSIGPVPVPEPALELDFELAPESEVVPAIFDG